VRFERADIFLRPRGATRGFLFGHKFRSFCRGVSSWPVMIRRHKPPETPSSPIVPALAVACMATLHEWEHGLRRSKSAKIFQWTRDGFAISFTLTWTLSTRPSSSAITWISQSSGGGRLPGEARRRCGGELRSAAPWGSLRNAFDVAMRGVPSSCLLRRGSTSTAPSRKRSMRSLRTIRPRSSRSLLTRPTLASLTA
jgi:hypothetical protein